MCLSKEQQKNGQLETNLKDKDIKLRAALEENDILTFNNTQLTKKVTALQTTIQEVIVVLFLTVCVPEVQELKAKRSTRSSTALSSQGTQSVASDA